MKHLRAVKRTSLRILGALAILVLAVASVSAQSLPPRAQTIHVAMGSSNSTLDPQKQGNMIDMGVLINMFDMLVFRDRDMNLIPWLATEWYMVDDHTWQFKLREGVRFHNGEPFNAEAVKFSIERLLDPATASPIVELRHVTEVEVVDEYTVNIRTSYPDPLIPNKLTMFGGVIVPPQYIKEHGDQHFAQNPVGTGPFKFVEWRRDGYLVLEANEDYWRGAPEVPYVVFHAIPDDASRVAALQSGEIDVATNVPPDIVPVIERAPGVRVLSIPGLRVHYLYPDSRVEPLTNRLVRQAINHAIDVDALIEAVLGGHATRTDSMISEAMFGHNPDIVRYPYDPAKARQLLAEAGYPNGFELTLHATSGTYMKDRDVALAVAAMLNEAGIRTNVEILEYGTFRDYLVNDTMGELYFIGVLAWTLDGTSNMQADVLSTGPYSRIRDERLDDLIFVAASSMDQDERFEAYQEIQRILHEEAYFVPLWTGNDIYGLSNRVDWTPWRNQLIWLGDAKIR
ncbi:MAG: ABC transporter substrate-binding protein [Limnochordales bacterium]